MSRDNTISNRAFAVGNILEQYFSGLRLSSRWEKDSSRKARAVILSKFMKLSSRKWFMFNWMSDVTNYLSANIQFLYKITDTRHFNAKNLLVGKLKAKRAIGVVTYQQYKASAKPITLQFLDIMDASPDRLAQSVGERGSRTSVIDVVTLRVGFGIRAYLQNEANYTAMYALLDNKKYRFKMEGSDRFTTLDNAIELVDGVIQTKAGVPEEYSITYDKEGRVVLGKKIQQIIKHHKGYLKKTTGIAGLSAESEFVNRTLTGKAAFAVMRFLPGMTLDRYQVRTRSQQTSKRDRFQRRFDWYTQTAEYGQFIEAALAGRDLLFGLKDISQGNVTGSRLTSIWRNQGRKTAVMQVVMASIVNMLIDQFHLWLRFNDDDDDRAFTYNYYNLDGELVEGQDRDGMIMDLKNTTSLPNLPWIADARRADAHPWADMDWTDYWKLQFLRLSLRVERENKTFNPFRGFMLMGDMLMMKNAAQEGAYKDIMLIIQLMKEMAEGKDTEIKQNAGPYTFQQSEETKWTHAILSKLLGYNGNLISPADGIESEQAFPY